MEFRKNAYQSLEDFRHAATKIGQNVERLVSMDTDRKKVCSHEIHQKEEIQNERSILDDKIAVEEVSLTHKETFVSPSL